MQEKENDVSNRSQMSGSGHGDTSSAFLHSSKLRNKLKKLAAWRIDPSLIEFPTHSREFRGGFATVSQGFLASQPRAAGATKEIENSTDEHPSSRAGGLQSKSDIQNHGDDQRGKDGGADERKAGGNNDPSKGEASKDSNAEQERHNQPSILKIGHEITPPEDMIHDVPGSGDRDTHSNRDTETRDEQLGRDEGTDGQIVDGDSHQKREETGNDPESTIEEQNGDGQTSKPKIVAVKKLKVENDADLERVLGLALRESEFLTELSHPNVVTLEGFVEDLSEQKFWLIFPWQEHGNLRDFLASGNWEIPERISLIWDVTLGLQYLHTQAPPIYHGDLKSLNILVDSECHALITDFGSARHLEDGYIAKQPGENEDPDKPRAAATDHNTVDEHITLEAFFSATASTITLTGSSYTLRWAAPELLQDEKPCLRSDIWALGWIAYEVMTNTIPFHDIKKDAIVINRVIQGHLPSITEDARMSLIRALCSLMVRCWSINPDKRPTAEECQKLIFWMPMLVPASAQTVAEEDSQLRHAQLLSRLGNMYRLQADYLGALSCFNEALDIYTHHNNTKGRGETLRDLADVCRFRNEYTEATTLYLQALPILTELGYESERAHALLGLAETHRLRHDYDEAVKFYSECLQIHTKTGNGRERATVLWGLAEVHKLRGEYSEAINLYSEALPIFTEVGDHRTRAVTLWGLAEVHRFRDEYSEAINLYSEALQIYTDLGDRKERASTLWCLAEINRFQTKFAEASKLYSEALQIKTEIGDRLGRGTAFWGLAEVHRLQHDYGEAIKLYSEAMQILADIGDKHWGAEVLLGLAQAHQVLDHHSEAISFYTKVSKVFVEIGNSRRASEAQENAAAIRRRTDGAEMGFTGTVEVEEEPSSTSELMEFQMPM